MPSISPSNSSDAGLRPGTGILSDKDPMVFKRDLMVLTPAIVRRLDDDAVAGVDKLVGNVDRGGECVEFVDKGGVCVESVDKGTTCVDIPLAWVV